MKRFIAASAVFLLLFAAPSLASTVRLAWDHPNPASVAGYRLHFGTSSGNYATEVDVGNTLTSPLDVGLGDARQVFIAASAYDAAGNRSGYSNEVVWTAPDDLAPEVPTNLRIEVEMSRGSDGNYQIGMIRVSPK